MSLKAFARAAEVLEHGSSNDSDPATDQLLRSFGIEDHAQGRRAGNEAAVFRLAGRFERIFGVPLPELRGATLVGGTIDPARFGLPHRPKDVSGKSFAPFEALAGCVGEATEYLSSCAWGDERVAYTPASRIPEGLLSLHKDHGDEVPCLWGCSSTSGNEVPVPASLCLRGAGASDSRTASGYGAGATSTGAQLTAVLELVERDAAALWWHGRVPARHLALETVFEPEIVGLLGPALVTRRRRTVLLDITSELGVPVVAAVSFEGSGKSLVVATAARTSHAEAAHAALLEVGQMELALRLARGKLDRFGPEGIQPSEAKLVARSEVSLDDLPVRGVANGQILLEGSPGESALSITSHRLREAGVECYLVALTRPQLGIPCYRALAPALQELPVVRWTERLTGRRDQASASLELPDLF